MPGNASYNPSLTGVNNYGSNSYLPQYANNNPGNANGYGSGFGAVGQNGYGQTINNGGMGNNGAMGLNNQGTVAQNSPIPRVAANPLPTGNFTGTVGGSRTLDSRTPYNSNVESDALPQYGTKPSSRESITQLICLISFVANIYLIYLLNHLFNRYRTLQISARNSGTASIL